MNSTTQSKDISFADRILDALNYARMRPRDFAQLIASHHLTRFVSDVVYEEKTEKNDGAAQLRRVQTQEGKKAVEEVIAYLNSLDSNAEFKGRIRPLAYSPLVEQAAKDHANDLSESGGLEHTVRIALSLSSMHAVNISI